MRELSSAIVSHLNSRGPRRAHLMVWIEARNRDTGGAESIGFWTGADHEDYAVDNGTHTFYGAGTLLKMSPLVIETGLSVRTTRLNFSKIAPEVQLALRGYETYEAPVRIYVAYFDALTHALIDAPVRVYKGRALGLKMTRPKKGDLNAQCELSVLSSARELTRTLTLKKSQAALTARAPGDTFRNGTDVSGTVESVWGEIRAKAPEAEAAGKAYAAPSGENPGR